MARRRAIPPRRRRQGRRLRPGPDLAPQDQGEIRPCRRRGRPAGAAVARRSSQASCGLLRGWGGVGWTMRSDTVSSMRTGRRPSHVGMEAGDSAPSIRASVRPLWRSGRRISFAQSANRRRSCRAGRRPVPAVSHMTLAVRRPASLRLASRPERVEAPVPHLAAEQRACPRPAKRKCRGPAVLAREDEGVGEDVAHAAWLDIAPVRRRTLPPERVPICEDHPRGGVFHLETGLRPGSGCMFTPGSPKSLDGSRTPQNRLVRSRSCSLHAFDATGSRKVLSRLIPSPAVTVGLAAGLAGAMFGNDAAIFP